jgi:4-hydroxy-tetrahydrodipicolinate reductase
VKLANDIVENNKNYDSWELNECIMNNEKCTMNNEKCIMENVLPIEAIREGEYFGIHEVKAESSCDIISLRHEAFSREGFATGAVIAAEFLIDKKGLYTMNDLLNC